MDREDLVVTVVAVGLTIGLITSVTSCVKNDTNKRLERCNSVVESARSSDLLIREVCGRGR